MKRNLSHLRPIFMSNVKLRRTFPPGMASGALMTRFKIAVAKALHGAQRREVEMAAAFRRSNSLSCTPTTARTMSGSLTFRSANRELESITARVAAQCQQERSLAN